MLCPPPLLVLVGLGLYIAGLSTGHLYPVGPILLPAPGLRYGVGWGLIGVSLVWVIVAQWQMGASWRVGIDREHATPLVRDGLFRLSRNPIFLGMMVQVTGLLLILPDAVVLAIWISSFLLISVQIRLEEQHLRARHPIDYPNYAAAVRRWI